MIQRIKLVLASIMFSSVLLAPLAVPAMAYAAPPDDPVRSGLCDGVTLHTDSGVTCGENDTKAKDTINGILRSIINIFSMIVGFISVIMVIVGGLKYIMSNGDSGNITSAKNTIIYALIGLTIVALAQFLVRFVLSKVIG